MAIMVENINAQKITPAHGNNPKQLYEHQVNAIENLNNMNEKKNFVLFLYCLQAVEKLLQQFNGFCKR